jgi:O-Antigen ligase
LFYSAYLLLPLSIAIMLAGHHDRPILRKNSVFYSVLILLGVTNFLTVSRGGIAAMVLSLIVISLLLAMRWNGKLRIWAMVRGAVVFLSIIFLLGAGVVGLIAKQGNDTDYTYGKSGVAQLLSHLTSLNIVPSKDDIAKDDATAQRARARSVAREELGRSSQRLVFGFGPGQYKERVDLGVANVAKDPNNLILQLILDYGLVGLGFLLWILFGVFKFLMHEVLGSPVIMRQGVAIALLGYFTGWLFQSTTYSNYSTITLWVAIGLVLGIANERINSKKV